MPIVEVHLLEGAHSATQHADLLAALTRRYAEVLDSQVERIRAVVVPHRPEHWATGGEQGVEAPYFTALVLEGRPVEQRHRLLGTFTDVIVDVLGVERALVRGRIVPVHPDDWGIGGVPASAARRTEIAARPRG
jgi:phenylpyruvate tautomerase PptA (4-oxalocrotonate tautomerase family)